MKKLKFSTLRNMSVFLILIFFTAGGNLLYAASWKTFRQGADRTGAAPEQAYPYTTFTSSIPGWVNDVQEKIFSSAIVKDGAVYFGARDGSVWCLDAYTGAALWQYSTDGWVDSTPALSGDFVYVVSRDGNAYCFRKNYAADEDPQPVWTYNTGSNNCSSPLIVDGKVYFVSGPPISGKPDGNLYILDANSGALLTKFNISQFSYSSPVISGGKVYFGTSDGNINCFDGNSVIWSLKTLDTFYLSSQGLKQNILYGYAGALDHKVYALDVLQSGKIIWKSQDLSNIATDGTSIAVSSDKAVVNIFPYGKDWAGTQYTSYLGIIYCIDLLNGATLWQKSYTVPALPKDSPGFTSSPAIANNVVYAGTVNGELLALDINTGSQLAKYQLDGGIVGSPAVSNGWVYVGTMSGKFYGIRSEKIVSINYPDNSDVVISTADIKVTVKNPVLTGYTLELGAGMSPADWQALLVSSTPPAGGLTDTVITKLNTASLADGIYSLRLAANNDASARAVNAFNVNNPPSAPLNVTASDTEFDGGGSLTVKWEKSSDDGSGDNDVNGYKVYKSTFAGGFTLLANNGAGAIKYIDSACPAGNTYYYMVRAFDALSDSADSVPASASSLADGVLITAETGGTVTLALPDGTTTEIEVPKGSVGSNVYMGIKVPDPADSHSNDGVPLTVNPTGIIRQFVVTPEGTKFVNPVIIKLPYRDADVVNIRSENLINLRVFWWNEQKSVWSMVNTSEIHLEEKRVWARVDHFSLFRIMEFVPGRLPLLAKESTYVYPNPAKSDRIYFKFLLGNAADLTVDVYNVAGELIWHTVRSFTQADAGLAKTIEWDISGKASGTYVYRVNAKSGTDEKTVTKKLAIIH